MTSGAIENDAIELAVLKNPDIDTEIASLGLPDHHQMSLYSPRLKLMLQTQVTTPSRYVPVLL